MSLSELNERADALEEEYNGELRQYDAAKEAAEEAQGELDDVNARLDKARASVSELAATRYKSTGIDPAMEIALASSPEEMLESASLVSHVADSNGARVLTLQEVREEQQQAADKADAALEEAKELVEDLEGQREEVAEKIERYEAEQTPAPPPDSDGGGSGGGGTGTVPESAKGWGFNGATPRMAAIRDEIIGRFGAPYPVGCLRPGDSGEHGSGRACDFMMSAGGAMPSAANQQLGQQIADYARANADRLGVMYVIWEQRIWDSRNPGAGWKAMPDRGSVTANHYDHVHVSSY
ncbi:coiled-coil domain-containing protein [Salinactinospora qingdaonensis]|uniref:ARB-07466-like C-terminal domain-containing protein n=1 Tax=Salinactinospora qingdaonensis TaxID=702744 RepID=A0ABP7FHE7_9ACTN